MKKLLLILFLFTGIAQGQAIINSYAHAVVGGGGGGVPVLETQAVTEIASNATSQVATAPTGITDDDILVMIVFLDYGGTSCAATSTGWAELSGTAKDSGGSNAQGIILWKRASSESGNYTVNWTGSEDGGIIIMRISGCVTSGNPFDVVGTFAETFSKVATPTDITTTEDDTLAIAYGIIDQSWKGDGAETATGTGWSTVYADGNGGAGCAIIIGEKDQATAGSVGSPTLGTWNANDSHFSQIINLKS